MRLVYADLNQAIQAAGFYTITRNERPDRLICASKRSKRGLTGNSFWIAERAGRWFVGTWGSYVYEFPDVGRVAEFCITWLSQMDKTCGNIEEAFRLEFQLAGADEDFAERMFIFKQKDTGGGPSEGK